MKHAGLGQRLPAYALTVLSLWANAGTSEAQDAEDSADVDAPAASRDRELEELRRTVDENQRAIESLRAALEQANETNEAQESELKALVQDASGDEAAQGAAAGPVQAGLSDHDTHVPHRTTVRDDHTASPRPGNAIPDPTYEGFYSLLDGKVFIKPGGYVKIDAILDSTRVGNPNKFVTASIPVEGEAQYGSPEQFNLHAKQTRLSMDLRWPTSIGSVRLMYENDFYGDGLSPALAYNMRHLYAQVANVTLGQTWTLFIDPDVIPDSLDFAGPGVQSMVRQAQVRYTFSPIHEVLHIALSAELPSSDVALLPEDGSDRRIAPDGLLQVRLEGQRGHLQATGLVRAIAYDSSSGQDDAVLGWGLLAAGALNTFGKDTLIGSIVYGHGVGRYMQDLGSAYGAYVGPDGKLKTIPVWGMHAGYRHFWLDNLSSQVTYGHIPPCQ